MAEITITRSSTLPSALRLERVPFDAPWSWLAAGWRDVWAVPHVSLAYGAAFALVAGALTLGLALFGLHSLLPALSGGFLLIGPLAAIGLYEISRRLEAGKPVAFEHAIQSALDAPNQVYFFCAVLGFAFLVWFQLALLLFMLFLGPGGLPPPSDFIPTLLFTPRGLGLLVTGTAIGAVLAFAVFAISAISIPLLMTTPVDVVTAMRTSARAVAMNPKPLMLWAALIAGFTAAGIATLFAGLILAFPLIGHATWHAFRELLPDAVRANPHGA